MSVYNTKKNKLGFFAEKYLMHCGKKDAKNNVLRKGEDDFYESPFIRKEISLCAAAIEEEKIALLERIVTEHLKIESFKVAYDKHTVAHKTIEKNYNRDFVLENRLPIEDDLNDSFSDLFEYHKKMSDNFAKSMRIHNIDIDACDVRGDVAKSNLIINKEYEIAYIKCLQYTELLRARIFAYWNGVLKFSSNDITSYIIFDWETIRKELHTRISEIKKINLFNYNIMNHLNDEE